MASIEKRGKVYRVRWWDPDGRQRSQGPLPTRRAAEILKRSIEEAVGRGERWSPPAAQRLPLLQDLTDAYLADLCRTAEQATIDSRHARLSDFVRWCEAHGKRDCRAFSRSTIEAYDADMVQRPLSVGTRSLGFSILRGFWSWCATHDEHRHSVAPLSMPKAPQRISEPPVAASWAVVDAVVERTREMAEGQPLRAYLPRLALLLRAFGLRLSQCLTLAWPDLDLEARTLRVRTGKSLQERAGRVLLIPEWFVAEAATWGRREGLVVGRVVARSQATALMRKAWASTLNDGQSVSPDIWSKRPDHAFRKTMRTELIIARCHPEAIEFWQGRASGVRGIYTDPRAYDLAQIAASIPAPCARSMPAPEVLDLDQRRAKRVSA